MILVLHPLNLNSESLLTLTVMDYQITVREIF
jgi:hypothetical protein